MDLYAEHVLDHYRHPRNNGHMPDPSIAHEEKNLSCGDTLTVDLRMDERGAIAGVAWSGEGCAISQAAMSMLSETIIGKDATAIAGITPEEVYALLGVPVGPRRFKCALLGLHTLKNAMRKAEGKDAQSWTETVALRE